MNVDWFKENAKDFSGTLAFDEPLSRHTYYQIGGKVPLLVIPKSESDVEWISRGLSETSARYFILGAGSNLLVSDQGFPGLVVKTTRMNLDCAAVDASNRIRVGGSVMVSSLLRKAVTQGWKGLEFLAGVPGAIGGVVAMNAGTHLGEAKDRLKKVEVLSLSNKTGPSTFQGDELQFQYRKNLFLPEGTLVWATEWEIELAESSEVKKIVDETLQRRKSSQPIEQPSCGSVFKNPREKGLLAWQVIERLGLRGHRIGHAEFSPKHPNFIVNLGGAKATDVLQLIDLAKSRAQSELDVTLECEVKLVGF